MSNVKAVRLIFCGIILTACITEQRIARPDKWAAPVPGTAAGNFYKVDEHLYRSAQPLPAAMKDIEQLGIENILNLRYEESDDGKAAGTSLKLFHVPMDPSYIQDRDVVQALKVIKEARGPVLVHCWFGSDRTGLIIAMYRIIFQGWNKKDAIDEMVNGGYNFHIQYNNIIMYIEDVDVNTIKKALANSL